MTDRRRGKFLVFEGPDGGGKTHHLELACRALREHGQWWVRSSAFRDHKNAAAQLRLIREDAHVGNPLAEILMVLAALESTWTDIVNPALAQGYNVLMDRWLMSTWIYQVWTAFPENAKGRRDYERAARWLEEFVDGRGGYMTPDAHLIFTAPEDECRKRCGEKPAAEMGPAERDADKFSRIYQKYAKIRTGPDGPVYRFDTSGDEQEVAAGVLKTLRLCVL